MSSSSIPCALVSHVTLIKVILALWCCSLLCSVAAVNVTLSPKRVNRPAPPNWVDVMNSLTQMLRHDADFGASLESVFRDSAEAVDYCRLSCVICDDDGMINLTLP